MKIHSHIRCPACQGALVPTELRCDACDLTIHGHFQANEFASLGEDDLHFLRIFVLCEGRIREMESALGVSYPSIKLRLAQLKATLAAAQPSPDDAAPSNPVAPPTTATAAVLKELEAGHISFDDAMAQLKKLQTPTQG